MVFIGDVTTTRTVAPSRPAPATESRTRERVRQSISEHGPLTAAALAQRLGLTPAAVRRHLDALAAQGAVEEREPASSVATHRGRGRPARSYVLTRTGHRGLGSDYGDVATSALRYLRDVAGEEAVTRFARERVAVIEHRYAESLATAPAGDVTARTQALADVLSADGFAASARPVRGAGPLTGTQLCQGHCPVQQVAAEFPQLCDAETDAFSRLLGVHVQRLATQAHGEHVCTTFVPDPVRPAPTPKAHGTTPKAHGTTPKAHGTTPRSPTAPSAPGKAPL